MNEIIREIETKLAQSIDRISPVSGGSINGTYHLQASNNSYFLKVNNSTIPKDFFTTEAKSLELLKKESFVRTPSVISVSSTYLLMEFIQEGTKSDEFWRDLAIKLSSIHKVKNPSFGASEDNYIGALLQKNNRKEKWVDFFTLQRMIPQTKLAYDNHLINDVLKRKLENFCNRIPELFSNEQPSLVHGDLWSGNVMTNSDSNSVFIDPSCHYSQREVDIAMTKLFGGFSELFYRHYNEVFPLEKGWETRVDYFNLYPLLVHVNLFGKGYVSQVKTIVDSF